MTIDNLPTFPGDAPDKNTQTVEEFDSSVQAWVDYTLDLPDNINTFIEQLNSDLGEFAINMAGATSTVSIYSASVTYEAGEQVLDPSDNYAMYTSQTGSNTGNTPSSDDGTYWIVTFGQMSGADTNSSATDVVLTSASKQIQDITMTAADKFVTLPAAGGLRKGADTFVFINSGNYRFGVRDNDGGFVCSIAPGGSGRVNLLDKSTDAGSWSSSDGADLLMNRIKTICNSDSTLTYISSCKLTATEVFIAWSGYGEDGFCAVLTWDSLTSEIIVSNILEFEPTKATYLSVCRMTDTVAIIGYSNTDSDGYCAAITYDGVGTLTLTHTFEFLDATTITGLRTVPIYADGSDGKIAVFTIESQYIYAFVLKWDGSVITSVTSKTIIFSTPYPPISYLTADLMSGSVSSASIIIGYDRNNMLFIKHVSWNGASLNPLPVSESDGFIAQSEIVYDNTIVAIDPSYVLCIAHKYISNIDEIRASLIYWNGSTFEHKREIILHFSTAFSFLHGEAAKLIGPNTVLFTINAGAEGAIFFKIKVVGSSVPTDCVLFVESRVPFGKMPGTTMLTHIALSPNGAIFAYKDSYVSNYLAAEYIDIG